MSQSRLRYILSLAIWTICTIGFCVTLISQGGPATYDDDSPRRMVGGLFLAFGMLGTPVMRWITRIKSGKDSVGQDERDEQIQAKATNIGMIIIVVAIFFTCIALSDAYQEADGVPVAWLWVIAYSTLILSHLAPTIIGLAMDFGMLKDAP